MSEKIATEKELFTLGGGLEGDKPTNYDINRCVTKTRSTAFKSVTANLTAYQDLQLIPVNLFGKVVMADTIQIEFESNESFTTDDLAFDIVLSADSKETHYSFLYYMINQEPFHTYDWTYDESFVETIFKNNLKNKKKFSFTINLNRVKEIMKTNSNGIIKFKTKWCGTTPQDKTINYSVKFIANEKEKYTANGSINLLTHEPLHVDVFYRKIFEIKFERENNSIILLNNSEPDRTAIFDYDLLIKRNSSVYVNKHMTTNANTCFLNLNTKDFNKGDTFTLDVRNFKIKLFTLPKSEYGVKTIIPKFTKTKIGSKIKNGCKLSVLKNDIDHYVAQVEILEDLQKNTSKPVGFEDLNLGKFNDFQNAFEINLNVSIYESNYNYYNISDNNTGKQQIVDIF